MGLLSALITGNNGNEIFRSLKYRNFRLFFIGQSLSLIGTWMQKLAMGWLVYRTTHSAVMLGVVAFAGQIPSILITPAAGVVADRYNKHKLLVITQTLAMIQAIILAAAVITNTASIPHLIILSIFLGVVDAFDMPIRQAFVIKMIDKKHDIGNAIAINSSMVNTAKLLGPSIAGIVIATVGEGMCFALNAISYMVVIGTLLMMKINTAEVKAKHLKAWHQLKEGFTYTFGFSPVKNLIALLALVSLMGMPYMVVLPVFAKDILHGGAQMLGLLTGASGMGALAGAVYLATRKTVLGLGKIIVASVILFGVALICFALSETAWLSIVFIFLAGLGMMVQMAACNTILQTMVEDNMRGRVMSFYTMAFTGTMPFGSLIAGVLVEKIGAADTLIIGGSFCIAGAIIFYRKLPALKKLVHPIYVQKGIIPSPPTMQ